VCACVCVCVCEGGGGYSEGRLMGGRRAERWLDVVYECGVRV